MYRLIACLMSPQTLLNDFDVSSSHLERLTRDLCESPSIGLYFTDEEQPIIRDHIVAFSTLVTKFRANVRVSHIFLSPNFILHRVLVWHRTTLQPAHATEATKSHW